MLQQVSDVTWPVHHLGGRCTEERGKHWKNQDQSGGYCSNPTEMQAQLNEDEDVLSNHCMF